MVIQQVNDRSGNPSLSPTPASPSSIPTVPLIILKLICHLNNPLSHHTVSLAKLGMLYHLEFISFGPLFH